MYSVCHVLVAELDRVRARVTWGNLYTTAQMRPEMYIERRGGNTGFRPSRVGTHNAAQEYMCGTRSKSN